MLSCWVVSIKKCIDQRDGLKGNTISMAQLLLSSFYNLDLTDTAGHVNERSKSFGWRLVYPCRVAKSRRSILAMKRG